MAERSVPQAVLQSVRSASHDGFDRTVFEFEGGVPGYHVEYIDRPVPSPIDHDACGSLNGTR